MQEVKKRRIVLASVLKPVNDSRMFEKMGLSLANDYEVHIIGTESNDNIQKSKVVFHPLPACARISIQRIVAPFKILRRFFFIKPDLIILSTHELLWTALVVKIFLNVKVIYDVRENYFRNILHTNAFPRLLKVFIASYVRIKEWMMSPLIDVFFLAEAGYEKELRFVTKKKLILENKVKKMPIALTEKWGEQDGNIHLLFSGTLAETTGVFSAIDLAAKLHAVEKKIRLLIIGHSPLVTVNTRIRNHISDKDYIQFKGGYNLVPHLEILDAIAASDFGIIAYPSNLSTQNTVPTKLFEYLGYKLPILLINYAPWIEICRPYLAALSFDLKNFKAEEFIMKLRSTRFYSRIPSDVFWESEEKKLLAAVSGLLK